VQRRRRVPEAALAVGVLLSGAFVSFVLVLEVTGSDPLAGTGSLATIAVALALLYPFAAWAVVHADDPTWALPPDVVAAVGGVVGVGALALGVAAGAPLLGVLVGLLASLPPAAYWTLVGTPTLAPRQVLVAGGVAGTLVVVGGVVVGAPSLAALDAVLAWLAAVGYHAVRDGRRLPWEAVVGGGVVSSSLVAGVAVATGASTFVTLASVATVAFCVVIGVYATALGASGRPGGS
jgi:hypothetical protein